MLRLRYSLKLLGWMRVASILSATQRAASLPLPTTKFRLRSVRQPRKSSSA